MNNPFYFNFKPHFVVNPLSANPTKCSNTLEQEVGTLVSIYFGSPRLGHTIETNDVKLETVDPEIYSIVSF